jgi:hypothetical protein
MSFANRDRSYRDRADAEAPPEPRIRVARAALLDSGRDPI